MISPSELAPYLQVVLMIAAGLAFVRLVRGPSLGDRVVAVEIIGAIAVGVIVLGAIESDQPILLDIALLLAIVSFLGTLGFARFVLRGPFNG